MPISSPLKNFDNPLVVISNWQYDGRVHLLKPKETRMDKICKELDKIRKERGMTYPELAYAADLSRPTLDMV